MNYEVNIELSDNNYGLLCKSVNTIPSTAEVAAAATTARTKQ